jgi:hypothetical protein
MTNPNLRIILQIEEFVNNFRRFEPGSRDVPPGAGTAEVVLPRVFG